MKKDVNKEAQMEMIFALVEMILDSQIRIFDNEKMESELRDAKTYRANCFSNHTKRSAVGGGGGGAA